MIRPKRNNFQPFRQAMEYYDAELTDDQLIELTEQEVAEEAATAQARPEKNWADKLRELVNTVAS